MAVKLDLLFLGIVMRQPRLGKRPVGEIDKLRFVQNLLRITHLFLRPEVFASEGQATMAGLTTGAKAGIGAGVSVSALVMVSVTGLLLWEKSKSRSSLTSQIQPLDLHAVDETRKGLSPPYSAVDPKHDDNTGSGMLNMPQDARLQDLSSGSELSGMSELPGDREARELGVRVLK